MADASPKTQINSAPQLPSDHANQSKFFLYKAALVTVFLLLLPLFPSLAPDFINQTLHARSWELLQLIFVGIAVSYGLFSKKNDEPPKDNPISKMDNAQSYISKLLQVSSVFDDDSDNHTEIEESKFQALNSQYYRGEPVLVVAKERPAVEETNGVVSQINQKPLLLPVRSLKQRVPSELNLSDDSDGITWNSSRAGSNNNLKKSRNVEENAVLRSPIPWRSRSGRMEMKKDGDDSNSFSASPSMEERELKRVEARSFRSSSSRANASSFPKVSSVSQCEGVCEDRVRKKSLASPPPAPPPPPPPPSSPPFLRKSSSSIGRIPNGSSSEKVLRRSVRSVPTEELNENEIYSGADSRFGLKNNDVVMKSVRTFRLQGEEMGVEKEFKDYEMKFIDRRGCSNAVKSYTTTVEEEEEQKKQRRDELVVETTTTTEEESEEEEIEEEDTFEESPSRNAGVGSDGGPDVDKKADEFIAKFREQIRLQRIESIRRSTAQRAGKSLR